MKTTALSLFALATVADAHGRLVVPPHRGHIGRLAQFAGKVPIDYSDNGLSAGGIGETSGGKHGVCGDAYSKPVPREHENGGLYGRFAEHGAGVIGACYAPGQTVDVTVQITANHMGYFEFGLCKLNSPTQVETEECFQLLAQPNGETKWNVPSGNDFFKMKYVLPSGVTCEGDSHCVFRWHYIGWNNWGQPIWGQEHFWNCADVYISNNCNSLPTLSPTTASPSTSPTTTKPPTPSPPTTQPATAAPTPRPTTATPVPGDKCDGNHNVCYWPQNHQIVPYGKADCLAFSTFVWCD